MRKYKDDKKTELAHVFCNCCKKELRLENGIVKEGVYAGNQEFSYFSNKDGEIHSFDLCEDCYDKIIAQFEIPVEIFEKKELL